jgi:hypothetical protein
MYSCLGKCTTNDFNDAMTGEYMLGVFDHTNMKDPHTVLVQGLKNVTVYPNFDGSKWLTSFIKLNISSIDIKIILVSVNA